MKLSTKCLTAALLLFAATSTASAQTYWTYYAYGRYGPPAKGYYGTSYDGGPRYGGGGSDQYGYGAIATPAKPSRYHRPY